MDPKGKNRENLTKMKAMGNNYKVLNLDIQIICTSRAWEVVAWPQGLGWKLGNVSEQHNVPATRNASITVCPTQHHCFTWT